ncbi:MAG: hypothetical protein EOP50_03905 [Sphingobacteriales bacterium]|nr:MAG: hypothetical protein EOP50_03905 [Sphingobacteriales bacterium]
MVVLLFPLLAVAQQGDSADVEAVRKMVTMSEVVVRSDLNVPRFLQRIRTDSSYYKAFKNLHILGYTAENYIELFDKKGRSEASLRSTTRQQRAEGCRTMDVVSEQVTGDFYDSRHDYNYYTAQLYDAFFFTHGKVCGETNIVAGSQHQVQGKKGLEKNKEQLKLLFFNPGQKIPGIPFIGNKLDVFDEDIAKHYNYSIDTSSSINGIDCYVFRIVRRDDLDKSERGDIVFDNITTWFNQKTMEIVGRTYDLSYDAGVYDFDVHMKVEMIKVGPYVVPYTLSYRGNWHLMFKGRERGVFNATLHDFKIP